MQNLLLFLSSENGRRVVMKVGLLRRMRENNLCSPGGSQLHTSRTIFPWPATVATTAAERGPPVRMLGVAPGETEAERFSVMAILSSLGLHKHTYHTQVVRFS